MTLRRRLALLSAGAVALTVVLASALIYLLVRDSLRDQIDDDLREQADRGAARLQGDVPGSVPEDVLTGPGPPPGAPPPIGQVVRADGTVLRTPETPVEIPVTPPAQELAADGGDPSFEDVEVDDVFLRGVDVEDSPKLRVLTQPLPEGGAIQVAASLQNTEDTLSTLVLILFLVSAGGVAVAAALGPVVARAALSPAGEVSAAAEEVARTHDLTRRIEVRGDDELGRLAASFNEMMSALERSEAAQRRLVADASHELRTPLATLRTNIETLGRGAGLDAAERERVVADLTDELEEMTHLVGDVVELAREPGANRVAPHDVRLDELAADATERARRRARSLTYTENLSPTVVSGDPARIGRAISNLLDNAAKWSPDGGEIEVVVGEGRVSVRDRGPGFAEADLPKVFDRFWRADEARGTPGSGLGLAIVKRVAEEHGGRATAANAEGGGALVEIRFPEPQLPS